MRALAWGAGAAAGLFGLYAAITVLLSGFSFLAAQVAQYWYYLVPLSAGFGIQVWLYVRVRAKAKASGSVVAASGTVSGVSMISCCVHYAANLAPALAATGIIAFAAQYQVELFWVGLLSNIAGIALMARQYIRTSMPK